LQGKPPVPLLRALVQEGKTTTKKEKNNQKNI